MDGAISFISTEDVIGDTIVMDAIVSLSSSSLSSSDSSMMVTMSGGIEVWDGVCNAATLNVPPEPELENAKRAERNTGTVSSVDPKLQNFALVVVNMGTSSPDPWRMQVVPAPSDMVSF